MKHQRFSFWPPFLTLFIAFSTLTFDSESHKDVFFVVKLKLQKKSDIEIQF